ncbi:MAG: PorP/SprF family type IX secretion system membrane protein [Saprospiraceae bacterium]|nr:PorP/SprF family type IX secretion system membrane protein [Saprospiraceae bacterium]
MVWRFMLLLFFLNLSKLAFAQDPSFSQFYANRIYLNPAFTGIEQGMTVAAVSRLQWLNVDSGFRTIGFSLELQEPAVNSALGLSIYQDRQGLAQLNSTYVGFSYAYTLGMKNHNLHFGLQARWVEKKVDWEKITFSDQLDPVYGDIYPTSAVPILSRVTFTDFDAGIVWRFVSDIRLGKKRFRDTRHSLGIAIHHLPQLFRNGGGLESFQQLETRVAPRFTAHMGSVFPIVWFGQGSKNLALSPTFKIDYQGEELNNPSENLQVFSSGAYIVYDGFYIGALYQNKRLISNPKNTNALILAFGAYIQPKKRDSNNLFVGFSYDANTTGVGPRAGGVFELAVRVNFVEAPHIFGDPKRRRSKKPIDCYQFF